MLAEKPSWEDTDLKKMKEEPRECVGQKFLLEMWVQEARVWQVGLEANVARAEQGKKGSSRSQNSKEKGGPGHNGTYRPLWGIGLSGSTLSGKENYRCVWAEEWLGC